MRALIQRVTDASVSVHGRQIGAIGPGLLVLICAMQGDSSANADKLAAKIINLRIFADDAGKMNRALTQSGGAVLVVSQFTLAADTTRGNRPGFSNAANPADGRRLYDYFSTKLAEMGLTIATGKFGADMAVTLTNDGPVTIWLDV